MRAASEVGITRHRAALAALLLGGALAAGCGGGGGGASVGTAPVGTAGPAVSYVAALFTDAQIVVDAGVVYSRRPNEGGMQYSASATRDAERGSTMLELRLDVAKPPNASPQRPQPLLVWVHGGGFIEGGRGDVMPQALSYARAGYVVASIDYRLSPFEMQDTLAERQKAILQATEDTMNAVRFLKLNAGRYGIDPSRIAMLGGSSGGAIALFNAIEYDTLSGAVSDFAGVSARVDAVVDSGATYKDATYDADRFLRYDAGDTPVLLLHADPTDGVTGATWLGNALPTKQRIDGSGNHCTLVAQPDGSHSVDLSLGGPYSPHVQPFLADRLRLASLL